MGSTNKSSIQQWMQCCFYRRPPGKMNALDKEALKNRCSCFTPHQRRRIRQYIFWIGVGVSMLGFFLLWVFKGILFGLLFDAIVFFLFAATFGCLGMVQLLAVCLQGKPTPHLLCVESTDFDDND